MTIKEYIQNNKPEIINGIKFTLFAVNYDEDLDITEKSLFDNDEERDRWLSFLERLEEAKEEINNDTKDKTEKEVKDWYKLMTCDGNQYYWGGMIWVSTSEIDTDDGIYYGVRMD